MARGVAGERLDGCLTASGLHAEPQAGSCPEFAILTVLSLCTFPALIIGSRFASEPRMFLRKRFLQISRAEERHAEERLAEMAVHPRTALASRPAAL